MDTIDLLLAMLHHVLVFSLAAVIAAEVVLLRGELSRTNIGRLAGVDRSYGLIAMLVIVVGVCRVFFGLKGWEFYVYNWSFWLKMAAFAAVGLLSILPTIRIIAWNRRAGGEPAFQVPAAELVSMRVYLRAEMALFMLIPIFAAMMARGYGA